MSLHRRHLVLATAATLAAPALRAQGSEPKPLQIVLPVPPGGSVDLTGRLLAEKLPALLKQPCIVENRAGASGTVAAAHVARMAGDPNVFMLVFDSHATNPLVFPQLSYDTQRDFTPLSRLLSFPLVWAVPASLPVSTMAEFIELVRREPGRHNYSSAGLGTLNHLAVELFKQRTRTHLVHIPYRGGVPALQAVMSGEVQLFAGSWVAIGPHVKSGRVKVLGVTSAKRYAVAPELPTLAESGVPGFDVGTWIGALAPARIGAARTQQLQEAIVKALLAPDVQRTLAGAGLEWVGSSAADFETFIAAEQKRWSQLAREQGLQFS